MNTDVRRAIFCAIVTSDDYLDAFEKLMRLKLSNKQDREIVNVLVHCCQAEKNYNPFYGHLATKLCSLNSTFRVLLDFGIHHSTFLTWLCVGNIQVCTMGKIEDA